jgi:ParB-like chromosome segregation protein Spo0J
MSDINIIPVSSIRTGRSPRINGENEDHIFTLAATQGELPPILVHFETMQVIDGMHRLKAARLRGDSSIKVTFFNGTEEEAFVLAVKSNIAHGLPLTLADREAAAERLLVSQPERSDRWIADTAGISATTVASIRSTAGSESASETTRLGRDGRRRPLNTAEGRAAAQRAILANPEASLREIAKISGISPGTVRGTPRFKVALQPKPAKLSRRHPPREECPPAIQRGRLISLNQ